MAVDHDLPFFEFPDAYNFSDPALADHYATVTYTTEDGYTVAGRPITYNITVNEAADNPSAGRTLVSFVTAHPELLAEAGLTTRASLPRPHGSVPEAIDV
jgi:molybdate/tungstate transport system substrate-binding protein